MQQLTVEYKLADGREGTIAIPNRSRVQWDLTSVARKWGKAGDVPTMWATFITWDALVREGTYTGKWDDFLDDCLVADPVDDDDADAEADPTVPDQTPI